MKLRDIRRRAQTNYVHEAGFRFQRDYTSKRCRTYVTGCSTCDGWRFFDEHGRFVYTDAELWYYMLNLKIAKGAE
jgi:hypothetical protein